MRSPKSTPTTLLVIDLELGLTHPTAHSPTRSTPNLESNITDLLAACRTYNQTSQHPITIIHVHHHSTEPSSLLDPAHIINWSDDPSINGRKGVDPMPCAVPHGGEAVLTKSVNSAFIGTDLEARIRGVGTRQLVVVGMTTEHCVSSTVRMAADLAVCGVREGVVLVHDGCAAFGRNRGSEVWDGERVHQGEVEVLKDEFAEVVGMEEVLRLIG